MIRVQNAYGVSDGRITPTYRLEEPWEASVEAEEDALELPLVKRFKDLSIRESEQDGVKYIFGRHPREDEVHQIAVMTTR
jgi:hypothetical protein